MKVLLVEDDAAARHALERLLALRGHNVTSAATGEEAVAALDAEPPDVMLLDLHLVPGGMTGWDVARHKVERHPRVATIVVSGSTSAEVLEGAALNPLQGAMLILGKPVDVNALERALEALEGRR